MTLPERLMSSIDILRSRTIPGSGLVGGGENPARLEFASRILRLANDPGLSA